MQRLETSRPGRTWLPEPESSHSTPSLASGNRWRRSFAIRRHRASCRQAILEHGERSARQALAELPKGNFVAEEWIDDDGLSADLIRVCVKVTIREDEFIADYTGSAASSAAAGQLHADPVSSAFRSMFKAIADPQAPVNEGWFRLLKVICPEGTVFTA